MRSLPLLLCGLLLATACGSSNDPNNLNSDGGDKKVDLTVTRSGSGSGSVTSSPAGIDCGTTCDALFSQNSQVTLTPAPADGSTFAGWTGDCSNATGPCTVTMDSAKTVNAVFSLTTQTVMVTVSGTGGGTVTSQPAAIDCAKATSPCAATFPNSTSVTLTATADGSSTFAGWSGDCTGSGTCTVSVTAARNVTATFTANQYALSVSVGGTGTGSVSSSPAGIANCSSTSGTCSASYDAGTQVTLTATPSNGSTFGGWGGACTGSNATCTVAMSQAQNVSASFSPPATTYALSVAVTGNGTVSSSPSGISSCSSAGGAACTASFTSGTSVTLTATPSSGNTFTGWSGAGCTGTGTCVVSMTAAKSVTATFAAQTTQYALTVSVTGSGSVSSSPSGIASCTSAGGAACTANFTSGTSVTLTATASGGNAFQSWGGACSGTSTTCTVAMSKAQSVTATFAAASYALNVSVTSKGTVTSDTGGISCTSAGGATCSATYAAGTTVTLTAAPATYYAFSSWGGACSGATTTCTVTMSAVQSVTATFAPKSYNLTVSPTGTGTGSVSSSPAGISNCSSAGGTCVASFASGTTITLTASPTSGSTVSWSNCSSTSGNTCTVNFNTTRTVTVTFTAGTTTVPDVTNLAATTTLQGAHLTWTAATGAVHYEVSYAPQGGSFTTASTNVTGTSYDVTGLLPDQAYTFQVVTVDASSNKSAGATASGTTAFTGTAVDFVAAQQVTGLTGNTFSFTWNASELFVGIGNAAGTMLTANGDALWIGVDTDPSTDGGGSWSTVNLNSNSVIWPFQADSVVELVLTDSTNGTLAVNTVAADGTRTPMTTATVHRAASGGIDEIAISKADLGSPSAIRLGFVLSHTPSGDSFDLAPANPNATDVYHYQTSLTASLAPLGNAFNTAKTATSASAAVSPLTNAAILETFTVDRGAAASGPIQIRCGMHPFSWTVADTTYQLVDDGTHGDATAGDHVYTGVFNLGFQQTNAYFKFTENGAPEPLFVNDGVERVHLLSGLTEAVPALTWNTAWSASNGYTVYFQFDDPITTPTPSELRGNTAELGNWKVGSGAPVTHQGGTLYSATVTFSANNPVANPVLWKVGYSDGSWETNENNNHSLDDDVVGSARLHWTSGDNSTF